MPPSVLSPWYVVQRLQDSYTPSMEYFVSPESSKEVEEANSFTPDKRRAMLFQTLQSATRVAEAADADIRVLYDKKHMKEFNR